MRTICPHKVIIIYCDIVGTFFVPTRGCVCVCVFVLHCPEDFVPFDPVTHYTAIQILHVLLSFIRI